MENGEVKKHKWFDSIATRIMLIITILIIPLNILVITSTIQSITVVQNQALTSMKNIMDISVQQLENRISSISYYLFSLENGDSDFLELIVQNDYGDYILAQTQMVKKMSENVKTTNSADGYFFYSTGVDKITIVMPEMPEKMKDEDLSKTRNELSQWVKKMNVEEIKSWNLAHVGDKYWLIRMCKNGDFYYGAFISLDEVRLEMLGAANFKNMVICYEEIDKNSKYLSVTNFIDVVELPISICVSKNDTIRALPKIQWLAIILACIYISLVPVLFLVLNKMLLKPLYRIRYALLELKQGHEDYRISNHNYAEEFRDIYLSFNEMADHIKHLRIENYEKEIAKQKMELRNLQLQIHPHFLLNTFNLVYSLAQISDYKNIQKLALYLSNYFRYIFRSGKNLESFKKEIELIRQYLEISSIRYPNSFDVSYDIDEKVNKIMIPPLLVHTFIENVLNHSLEAERLIHIMLVAHYEEGWVDILIIDDGKGMSQDKVDEINKGQFEFSDQKRVHIGIANSFQRLKHFYGEKSVLTVESLEGKGTCFTLGFPYQMEEGEDEPFDS